MNYAGLKTRFLSHWLHLGLAATAAILLSNGTAQAEVVPPSAEQQAGQPESAVIEKSDLLRDMEDLRRRNPALWERLRREAPHDAASSSAPIPAVEPATGAQGE